MYALCAPCNSIQNTQMLNAASCVGFHLIIRYIIIIIIVIIIISIIIIIIIIVIIIIIIIIIQ